MSEGASAGSAVQAAAVLALAGVEGLTGAFDAPPVRAATPHAVVDPPVVSDWSAQGVDGREVRLTVRVVDGGERAGRVQALACAVEAAVAGVAGVVGGGWRVVAARLVQGRSVRSGERWTATLTFVVRVYREV